MRRNYMAANELYRVQSLSAFNLEGVSARRKLNQHATLYDFPDRSRLQINHTTSRADAWHMDWAGSAGDIALGPIKGARINTNARGDI